MSNESPAERLNGKLCLLFVAFLLAYVVASAFAPMLNQDDLGWQVAQGRWMVHHFAPYLHDAFNYPTLGQPVINEYPFFEVILYVAWSLGWWGPSLLCAAAYVALILIWVRGARSLGMGDSVAMLAAIGLALLFFQVSFPLRPHLVTYLAVSLLGVFLLRHRETRDWKIFWPMALVQIAWTNSHSAFVLGPAMVGLFGVEMILRRWLREGKFPGATAKAWAGGFVMITLASLVNPHGWARFGPVFSQAGLESIRAYVGEMEPLGGVWASICAELTFCAIIVAAVALIFRRGAVAVSFVILAVLLHQQAQSAMKAWPVFGLFIPLIVLSCGALASKPARTPGLPSMIGAFFLAALAAIAFGARLDPVFPSSLAREWHEYDAGRTEMPIAATNWLQAQGNKGRLFHRCEDGGWLQMSGFDQGVTFADTGFGKYSPKFIHDVGLVNERPSLLPHFIETYQPDFIVCNNFSYDWPYYLQRAGWRLIFYSPNSSVWGPKIRPDFDAVTGDEVMAAFNNDLAANGIPTNTALLGRNILALNSMGLSDFAYEKLTSLPAELHRAPWYWEAARTLCFDKLIFSFKPRLRSRQTDALEHEAESLGDDAVTADFRAHYAESFGDLGKAAKILEAIPPSALTDSAAELLLKIYLAHPEPNSADARKALALALRTDCFDLRNGRHWLYLADAEGANGNFPAEAAALRKALFYYPDSVEISLAARGYAEMFHDDELQKLIDENIRKYGDPLVP